MTDELLTRSERADLAKIRQEKWARIKATFPDFVLDTIQQLNQPYTAIILGPQKQVMRKTFYPKGCESFLSRVRIGDEVVVGG